VVSKSSRKKNFVEDGGPFFTACFSGLFARPLITMPDRAEKGRWSRDVVPLIWLALWLDRDGSMGAIQPPIVYHICRSAAEALEKGEWRFMRPAANDHPFDGGWPRTLARP